MAGCDDGVLFGILRLIVGRWVGVIDKVDHSLFHLSLQFSEEVYERLPTLTVGFPFEFFYAGTRGTRGKSEPNNC